MQWQTLMAYYKCIEVLTSSASLTFQQLSLRTFWVPMSLSCSLQSISCLHILHC